MPLLDLVPGVPGAEIHQVASLPATLEGGIRVAPFSVARPGALLRVMPGVGSFLARDGQVIEVCPAPDGDPLAIDQFLHGAVRAALVYQRGGFPLHGACLIPPGGKQAIAIAGASGAGKSTLAQELLRRRWSLLSDDLTAVYRQPDGFLAMPSRPGMKLWRDACKMQKIDLAGLHRLPGERDKYIVPTEGGSSPAYLAAIFLLDRTRDDGVVPITGPERLALLTSNSYRPHYVAALGCIQTHFELTCAISESIQIAWLRNHGSVSACADIVETSCSQ